MELRKQFFNDNPELKDANRDAEMIRLYDTYCQTKYNLLYHQWVKLQKQNEEITMMIKRLNDQIKER
jgi:hypothetical protein